MQGKKFITIDGVLIPTPATFSCSYDNIEEVSQSEAGTDRTLVTRLQKKNYTFTFQVTEFWRNKLLYFGRQHQGTCKVGSDNTMNGRFRVTSDHEVPYSNLYATPLYTVSATFTQI
jgi:hypothetical protein